MKRITLDAAIKQLRKNKSFNQAYERELLINAIAEMVVALRKNKQLTQAELADRAGTTQSVIARLENGADSRIPSIALLSRIAHAAHAKLQLSFQQE